MEFMKDKPDNFYDLAIVDPPYGMSRKMDGTGGAGRLMKKWKRDKSNCWDIAPSKEYFNELFRISKKHIIWGANNFIDFLKPTTNYIFWYKQNPVKNFADGELAWTNFLGTAKCFNYRYFGAHGLDSGGKIHPTQKPVALYKWTLKHYAKPNDKIIDTHSGSGSLRIACHDLGFDLDSCEIDKDYYNDNETRFKRHTAQQDLFSGEDYQKMIF
jgi:site-specific DNA-methyltransferase (adenine-specific)